MSDSAHLPVVSQNPKDPDFVQDPYPFYRHIRSLGDFVYWQDYDFVVATTRAAAGMVLRDPKLGREIPADRRPDIASGLESFYAIERHSLLEIEPPEHTQLRQIAMRGFNRSSLAAVAPDISRLSDSLIDAFPDGPFDVLAHFAQSLPALVITRFLGIEEAMAPQLQNWSNDMVAMYQVRRDAIIEARAARASSEFSSYVRDLIADHQSVSLTGFMSELIQAREDGDFTSIDELISTVILLLNAGHEASVHAIGNSIRILADRPDRTLALEPTNIAGTVEECLRFSPPLHLFTRYVYEDAVVLDHNFMKGEEVGALLGSACHDDAVWPDSEHFDPFRPRRSHLAFGSGIHACLGATLARLELQIALPILFSRCPQLKITEPPVFADKYHFHGLERLMVTLR